MSGLAVAKATIEYLRTHEGSMSSDTTPHAAVTSAGISSVSLLLGGSSLAYSPIQGPFSEYLTVSGFDRFPRSGELSYMRDSLEPEFHRRGFNFDRTARASKVTLSPSGMFRIETSHHDGNSCFEAEKVVLALGHTLRALPGELRGNVIQGAGELCVKLTEELPLCGNREECLGRLLSRYPLTTDGVVRIGLAGVGASMIEVVKILESLLDKPSSLTDKYRSRGSGTPPVELVIFDADIGREGTLFDGVCWHLRRFLSYVTAEAVEGDRVRAQEVEEYKRNAEARLIRFGLRGQVQVVPSRVDWDRVRLQDGFLLATTESSPCPAPLSVLIDCAPFEQGIGREQRAVIEELPLLNFHQLKPSLWKATRKEELCKGRLALAGAAFRPKTEWGVQLLHAQAKEIIGEFYRSKSVP